MLRNKVFNIIFGIFKENGGTLEGSFSKYSHRDKPQGRDGLGSVPSESGVVVFLRDSLHHCCSSSPCAGRGQGFSCESREKVSAGVTQRGRKFENHCVITK